ncbi:MAG TPA: hypothetical protein VEC93_02680 [Anaerolineae bacterium]|nr:hypothetical protein [Anaerolineae bacterium]
MEQPNSPQPLFCPYTGKQSSGQSRKEFAIPNGRIIWWHCTRCSGWHLIINNSLSDASAQTSDDALDDDNATPPDVNSEASKLLNILQLLS